MTWLVTEQFTAEREGILNVAVGGTGFQLETSGGKIRASGTFSFVTGIVYYYCFAVAFVLYGFINGKAIPKWLLLIGAASSLLAMVTAGSRGLIAECLQVVACIAILLYKKPTEFKKIATSIFGFTASKLKSLDFFIINEFSIPAIDKTLPFKQSKPAKIKF